MDRKILIYANDGVGLGHVAKLATLAHLLYDYNNSFDIHLISGYNKISNFLKEEISYIKIPSYNKVLLQNHPFYETKNSFSKKMRIEILKVILLDIKFDYIIIDMFAWGTKDELKDILPKIKMKYPDTKIILTLRGIIFSVERTKSFFKEDDGVNFLNNIYNKIVCLCDSKIIDLNNEYFDNKISIPIEYRGYIHYEQIKIPKSNNTVKKIVINFGGGYKCDDLLLNLLRHINNTDRADIDIHIILGEYLQPETKNNILSNYGNNSIHKTISRDEVFLLNPNVVIGCGGYNVMIDCVFNNIPFLVTPKTESSQEAILHTQILKQYSSIKVIQSEEMNSIWRIIDELMISKPSHELASFNQSNLLDFLN